jgi:hypothetical protein
MWWVSANCPLPDVGLSRARDDLGRLWLGATEVGFEDALAEPCALRSATKKRVAGTARREPPHPRPRRVDRRDGRPHANRSTAASHPWPGSSTRRLWSKAIWTAPCQAVSVHARLPPEVAAALDELEPGAAGGTIARCARSKDDRIQSYPSKPTPSVAQSTSNCVAAMAI